VPITYRISSSEDLISEVWLGDVSIVDLRDHWGRLLQDERALALRRTLVDMRGATVLFSDHELGVAVRDVAKPMLNGKNWLTAIVVRTPKQFHISSRYQGLAVAYSRDVIFSDVEEATRWLQKQQ
jgi:hypothetical protein